MSSKTDKGSQDAAKGETGGQQSDEQTAKESKPGKRSADPHKSDQQNKSRRDKGEHSNGMPGADKRTAGKPTEKEHATAASGSGATGAEEKEAGNKDPLRSETDDRKVVKPEISTEGNEKSAALGSNVIDKDNTVPAADNGNTDNSEDDGQGSADLKNARQNAGGNESADEGADSQQADRQEAGAPDTEEQESSSQEPHPVAKVNPDAWWIKSRTLALISIAVWFLAGLLVHVFATQLNQTTVFGIPLGFFMAAQGSLLIFVALSYWFGNRQNKIDRAFGPVDDE